MIHHCAAVFCDSFWDCDKDRERMCVAKELRRCSEKNRETLRLLKVKEFGK